MQIIRDREVLTLDDMMARHALCQPGDVAAAASLGPAPEINRWDLIKRGQPEGPGLAAANSHTSIQEL